ncbi:PKD domain-containing protein [Sphingomonas sp. LaA6.9]|uniref:PKD domain-containing protein n=1 Tax=Sphingomonas sp. LaA6.9 TaxID=2919914 RepID=UPI001F4F6A1D|nr:PKD domain-containing protein [Sphingomonas sp. LaA6.9]MCJ8156076.1 PKD domain-containing protein [Sphingomonas sp. LaA6.9]
MTLGAPLGAHDKPSPTPTAATAEDPMFKEPYIDLDEWRDAPVRHRYVHGGFRGTETRFSFYFPEKQQYEGRFFQHITPVPDSENNAQLPAAGEESKMGFAIASGAYFVETNGGGKGVAGFGSADPTIGAYRANAAAAAYSRVVAQQMYGGNRPYGYAYGGSGGAFRTIGSIENTEGVWDGVVPYVIGSTMAIPNMFSVRMHAMRILGGKFPQIVDAVEPGGSGDPYAGLSADETAALREVTRMGFPTPSWFGYKTMGVHGFAALYQGVVMADPTYFTDFWTKPGYLGFDNPKSFDGARLQHKAQVAAPITAAEAAKLGLNTSVVDGRKDGGVDNAFAALQGEGAQRIVAFRLSSPLPRVEFLGGDLIVQSGAATGQKLALSRIVGDVVILGVADPSAAAKIVAGDEVQVDNSNFLAAQTYHRHQVPGPDFKVWDQFRGPDGKPLYPQRPMIIGPLFVQATSGSQMTGKFKGKMIVVESLWDREAMPWQADWYRNRVAANLGNATDSNFRLWFTDHALHGDSTRQEDPTRTVSYLGSLQQALRDLSIWVEKGVAPPASTAYRIEDGQVIVPGTATERRGIQPVVAVEANGGAKAVVKPGQAVSFTATIEVPPAAGKIVSAEWDFEGDGRFPDKAQLSGGGLSKMTIKASHSFAKPGTYFPALRVASERNGDATSPYAHIQNLGRVRVVVE